ncbi:carnitine acetyltransferase [Fomitiporia mediterranea MF3/22]|uniref:carnitine acetyltransferase n=1 Tax=Fomitiporia mediterranea (strain MF3/22) TaxID=694068 RepID=UPI00044073F7|nr:carnitine acetyltransferase [Fomitiporia mediterranea MF3/22]EJD06449.1 carnitine acetyltransferase [Fomitiporia mediterranea MF3/22]
MSDVSSTALNSGPNVSSTSSASSARPLPRLPVPRLRSTLDRYLESLEPFLLEDEARGGASFKDAMRARVNMINEFERGLGRTLQERLLELDKKSLYNWLDDNFWLKKAYLECRAPLLINSNWWLAYKDDRTVPESVQKGVDAGDVRAGITSWQIRRAAWLLSRTLQFRERIESQELHPDTTHTGKWMRHTVPRMFNVCRIPRPVCDRLSHSQPSAPSKNKVMVMLHDWIYVVDVYDGGNTNIGHIELEKRIRDIVLDADRRLASGERALPIGVLTSDNRDNWTQNYTYISQLSPTNRETLQTIEDCTMAVSLDHYTYETRDPHPSELKSHLHNIRSGMNARNRWFDKGITLIVERNARAGMMGEHSPVDALVPSIVADYSLAADMESDVDWPPLQSFDAAKSENEEPRRWQQLGWVVDERLIKECKEAEERAKVLINDSDDDVMWFTEYGTDWIKNNALLPPDAFIQMVMQLAWYRTRGSFTATYETVLTRLFQHGRTETIRTLTTDSRNFVLAMCNPTTSTEDRLRLLRQAVKTHALLTKAAATGKGIDRHLLGLRLLMKDGESSPLFDDELFTRSQEWKLSTSGLSAGTYFRGTGFGAPYHDGYGVNYLAGPDVIKFGIESKFSCKDTSTETFKHAISSALLDMRALLQLDVSIAPKISNSDLDHVLRARL